MHRLNLHAIYAETGGARVDRDALRPEHFAGWVAWAKENGHGLDFNPTLFSHPKADSGLTLASYDAVIRRSGSTTASPAACIGESFRPRAGHALRDEHLDPGWPEGHPGRSQDARGCYLKDALDQILAHPVDRRYNLDAVEGKLFGIGSESYVVGSHEFYLGYAIANKILVTLDSGHYHPTETIADKLSAVLAFVDEVLLHVSRGVRWDSDHVVTLNDDLQAIAQELVRGDFLGRVHIGLDYFDASINRIAAWVIGTRAMQRALLAALLEPFATVGVRCEHAGDYTGRLALQEALKGLPSGAAWDYFCLQHDLPLDTALMARSGVRGRGAGETVDSTEDVTRIPPVSTGRSGQSSICVQRIGNRTIGS